MEKHFFEIFKYQIRSRECSESTLRTRVKQVI